MYVAIHLKHKYNECADRNGWSLNTLIHGYIDYAFFFCVFTITLKTLNYLPT